MEVLPEEIAAKRHKNHLQSLMMNQVQKKVQISMTRPLIIQHHNHLDLKIKKKEKLEVVKGIVVAIV